MPHKDAGLLPVREKDSTNDLKKSTNEG